MISVIIPAYNAQDTIQRCLDSVFNQTYKDVEVIVVDDGSKDDLALALTNCQNRLTILHQENKGAPAARNYGFSVSHGEYVIFLDADIVMKPNMLADLLQLLESNPDAAYSYSSFRWGWKKFSLWPFDPTRLKRMPFIHTSSLIRREAFPGFDESIKKFQDWDLYLTMQEKGRKGVYLPQVLFRITAKGTMSSWLPTLLYQLPVKLKSKDKYLAAQAIIKRKHNIN